MQGCKARTPRRCSNPSLSNPTKVTNTMEELGRKNNGGEQLMTPRSRSKGFPSLRGGIDWWSCRSRSPLPNPSKRCKNHRREVGGSKLSSRKTMEERESQKA
jgi:hypothetical protein